MLPTYNIDITSKEFPFPKAPWQWYQEWNNALFLHWEIPVETIKSLIPEGLVLDTFNNTAIISIVAYSMNNIKHRVLPSFNYISNFHQLNLRTYVIKNGKPGVYILHIEAEKTLSTLIARLVSNLAYEKAQMKREYLNNQHLYISQNKKRNFYFEAAYKVHSTVQQKTIFENWLLNRYYLYLNHAGKVFSYEVRREEWIMNGIDIDKLSLNYTFGLLALSASKLIWANYSKGVRAFAWKRTMV